jgi:apolipoprotein N-acyltransferase
LLLVCGAEPFIFTKMEWRVSRPYWLAALGGLLWWAAWPTSPLTPVAFFAFVPLLWVEEKTPSNRRFLKLAYLHMFLWNLFTTWWIYNASFAGAVLAIVLNSLLMCLPWLAMRPVKKRFGRMAGYAALVSFWITFEAIHHTWELSWPWLSLGNVFALHPQWVQWYEATGATGGAIWIWLSNLLLFRLVQKYQWHGVFKKLYPRLVLLLLLWVVPVVLSLIILNNRERTIANAEGAIRNVVVVQPNVDPYDEKFAGGTEEAQIQNLITLSEKALDSTTALVIWPETAIPIGIEESEIESNPFYQPVWQFLERHPQVSLLSGIESYRVYGTEKKTATARRARGDSLYYDVFNTAALLATHTPVQFYHKAKLVPGVETLPSSLLWMNSLFESFGGSSGSLGRDAQRTVFADKQHYFFAAPIICYESVYGDFVTAYVRKGANLLTIITNDGWWGNTQGYRQHMHYARLRAVETRRWIARSANTGISCFIDPAGRIYQPQPWDTKAVIKMKVEPLQSHTFFVRHGDYLSRISYVVSGVFLLLLLLIKLRNRITLKSTTHVPANKL